MVCRSGVVAVVSSHLISSLVRGTRDKMLSTLSSLSHTLLLPAMTAIPSPFALSLSLSLHSSVRAVAVEA